MDLVGTPVQRIAFESNYYYVLLYLHESIWSSYDVISCRFSPELQRQALRSRSWQTVVLLLPSADFLTKASVSIHSSHPLSAPRSLNLLLCSFLFLACQVPCSSPQMLMPYSCDDDKTDHDDVYVTAPLLHLFRLVLMWVRGYLDIPS